MRTRTALLSSALALTIGVVPGPARAFAGEAGGAETAAPDFSGRWVYNRKASDDARERAREGTEGRGGPGDPGMGGRNGSGAGMGGRGGTMGPPHGGVGGDDARQSMRAIFEPAEELAVTQTATEVAVEERFGRTRRLHPDGKKYKTDNGTSEIKTSWKEGKLVVETKRDRGTAVTETWELVSGGSRIIVTVKMRGGFGPGVTLERIYDRAKEGR